MNAPLRFNEALLIAGHAFEPFQCVAWAAQDGHGEVSLTVIDRTNTRIGRAAPAQTLPSSKACWPRPVPKSAAKAMPCSLGSCLHKAICVPLWERASSHGLFS